MELTVSVIVVICAMGYGMIHIAMWYLRRRRLYELASKFDGPPIWPIVGNAQLFVTNIERFVIKTNELFTLYASPFRIWIGPLLIIAVTDPEHINVICTSPKTLTRAEMFADYSQPLFGSGFLSAPVLIWRVHRKLIQPTFNPKILSSFVNVFAAQSRIFTDRIKRNAGGPEFEVLKLLSFYALDMICETAMGIEIGSQSNGDSKFVDAIENVLGTLLEKCVRFWWQPDLIFRNTQLGEAQRRSIKYSRDFAENVIQIKKEELEEELLRRQSEPGGVLIEDDARDAIPEREAFLDHLIKMTEKNGDFTDEDLRDEVITALMAGDHTIAITTSFAMLMLASHQDVQKKTYEELYKIYGNADSGERPVISEDLPKKKYLQCVIEETMRRFPITPFILRGVTAEIIVTTGQHIFPTGSTIAIGVLNLHRNEKYWPDPFKFDPGRFSPDDEAKRSSYAFMAFSGGPRNCVGLNYAMMAMKTLLATILREYVLEKEQIVPNKDILLRTGFIIAPANPIKMKIVKRKAA